MTRQAPRAGRASGLIDATADWRMAQALGDTLASGAFARRLLCWEALGRHELRGLGAPSAAG